MTYTSYLQYGTNSEIFTEQTTELLSTNTLQLLYSHFTGKHPSLMMSNAASGEKYHSRGDWRER